MPRVLLTRRGDELTGTVGDDRVDLVLSVPDSQASVRGRCLGAAVGGYWRIASNAEDLNPVGLFLGEFGGEPVFLRSEVHLSPTYGLGHVDVIGAAGDRELSARIVPVDRSTSDSSLVEIDGRFDGQALTFFAGVSGDDASAHLEGVVGGLTVTLTVTRSEVGGDYAGPPQLFPLLVASLLYFL